MTSYYNEIDPYAADWLENLIAAGHLRAGFVDRRSIVDVRPDDLAGYEQCHFFAGIGGWPYALDLAGWQGQVWTGSCPCQPLSSAGQRRGHVDERHLWPAFHSLITKCHPATVFGEQVASKDGREWLAGVRADLEALGYAVGAADMPACSVSAPHIRQRLWWVANAGYSEWGEGNRSRDAEGRNLLRQEREEGSAKPRQRCEDGGLGNPDGAGHAFRIWLAGNDDASIRKDRGKTTVEASHWDGDYIYCADGRSRRVEPSIFPLAHGVPNRVGRLRAYGNALVPILAAEFVSAFMEARP